MRSHRSMWTNDAGRSERRVEAAEALLRETVELQSRRFPPTCWRRQPTTTLCI